MTSPDNPFARIPILERYSKVPSLEQSEDIRVMNAELAALIACRDFMAKTLRDRVSFIREQKRLGKMTTGWNADEYELDRIIIVLGIAPEGEKT